MKNAPTLFIFSGLPATGKTALAQQLAKKTNAVYLRIDTVEQGLRDVCNIVVRGEGYRLAYRIASDNLRLGHNVVADSCNPIQLTRDEWQETAERNGAKFINIEIVCSDKDEHRNRIEERTNEIANLKLPTWNEVKSREYNRWKSDRIVIDTAGKPVEESINELVAKINTMEK